MKRNIKILAVLISLVLVAVTLGGCGNKGPTKEELAKMQKDLETSAAAVESSRLAEEAAGKVEAIPDTELELEDKVFINELEEREQDLLLPLSIKVPTVESISEMATIFVGPSYNISPNNRWISRMESNRAVLYHNSGIAVQFVLYKTKAAFKPDNIREELRAFHASFIEKSDYNWLDVFMNKKLSGHEVRFHVVHNDRQLNIRAGCVEKSGEVLIWTVNYFNDTVSDSEFQEAYDALFRYFKHKNEVITLN